MAVVVSHMLSVIDDSTIMLRIEDLMPLLQDGGVNPNTRAEILCTLRFDPVTVRASRHLQIYYQGHEFYERVQGAWRRSASVVMPLTPALKSLLVSAIVLELADLIGRSNIQPMTPDVKAMLPSPSPPMAGAGVLVGDESHQGGDGAE